MGTRAGIFAGLAGMACAMGMALPTGVARAATSTAAAAATVVAPVAVAATEPQLRIHSASGAGQLTIAASGGLSYAVVLQTAAEAGVGGGEAISSLSMAGRAREASDQGVLMTGLQTVAVAARINARAGRHTANIAATITYD
jgi:hypothetical protein